MRAQSANIPDQNKTLISDSDKGGDMTTISWAPKAADIQNTQIFAFMQGINHRYGQQLHDYQSLWQWSIENAPEFWSEMWDFADLVGDKGTDNIAEMLRNPHQMPGAEFFPEGHINYAQNMLRFSGADMPDAERAKDAIVFWGEDKVKRTLSRADIYSQVSSLAQFMRANNIGKGDRVAGFVSNCPEAIIGMLAASSIGAIWASASPDFGVQGVLDRFGQIEPKILIATEGYYYNGKEIDCLPKITQIVQHLPTLTKAVLVPYLRSADELRTHPALPPAQANAKFTVKSAVQPSAKPSTSLRSDTLVQPQTVQPDQSSIRIQNAVIWDDVLSQYPAQNVEFTPLPFNHPLYIMFSSGTTGAPKCIVHGGGGTLIQHVKEHMMQCDTRPDDRIFYFTTCGWMMWNWQITAMACGATLCLYDGSPFAPSPNILFDYADAEKFTLFGTSAKYIDALNKHNVKPKDSHDLSSIRAMTSTGSPLVHEAFDYVYSCIKPDMHLASISGGTDIVSCFVLGNPISPVHRGEIQCAGLGLHVDAADDNGDSLALHAGKGGEKGELVCRAPFPSMPVAFWNDPEGKRYKKAYFERFDNIWAHGDWIENTQNGGWIIYGRSDATLNPGGVRIGTAEIYRQVEQIDSVIESIAVGQDTGDGDVRVVLAVVLKDGVQLNDALKKEICTKIRSGASPRHVPAVIFNVSDIPRTKSGKITEIAVRDVIHGREIKNQHALANPEALEHFKDRAELI